MEQGGNTASILTRGVLLLATAGVAILNGLPLTAFFDSVNFVLYLFTRGPRLFNPDLLFYLTSVSITVATLLLAGVPAALYERIRGLKQSTVASLGIWLAIATLLSLPVLRALTGL